MIEYRGSIWKQESGWIVIPVNGFVKRDGKLVMGAGVAKQALDRYPDVDTEFGSMFSENGFFCQASNYYPLVAFPTKPESGSGGEPGWQCESDIGLIEKSLKELIEMDLEGKVVLPRIGCGNGGLDWNRDGVRDLCSRYLKHTKNSTYIVVGFED